MFGLHSRLTGFAIVLLALAACQAQFQQELHQELLQEPQQAPVGLHPSEFSHFPGFETGPSYIPSVPRPAPEVTPVALKPDLWRDLRAHLNLAPHLDQRRVQQEIRWLQRNPNYLTRLGPRLQRYLPYLFLETSKRDLPGELALLPIVESALDTFAFSHGGAAGPWQFVRGTARQYGLSINDWYDGRRDIVASTSAALDFLEDLHRRFDDWHLALAGYNAGQGNVNKALRKNPGATYFDLDLPRETKAYVPRLLALAAVVRDPDAFGLTLPEVEPVTTFHQLDIHSQFQIDTLTAAIGIDTNTFYEWNPALNQWATPPGGPHRVLIPVSIDESKAQQAIDAVPEEQRVDWTVVTVSSGDTLSHIAARHHTDIASLQAANDLRGTQIRAGRKLLIPLNPRALAQTPRSATGTQTYTVQPGDSLWTVARMHNVSLRSLMRNNHVGPRDTLQVGRTLKIPGATGRSSAPGVTRTVHYKVKRGDSLSRIATRFKVTVRQITEWNQLDTSRYLQPGQGLLLHVNVVGG